MIRSRNFLGLLGEVDPAIFAVGRAWGVTVRRITRLGGSRQLVDQSAS